MGTVVAMTYAPVQGVAKRFDTQSQTLNTVAKVLKALAQALKASFFGAILFAEIIRRMELVADKSEKLAKVCDEFSGDLKKAVKDHQSGDYKAGSYFGEGVSR
jgi:gas vesicle protein